MALFIQEQVLLAPYTTFRVGGAAKFFVVVKQQEELLEAVSWAKERGLSIFLLGGGSNVLVSSRGFDGLVIKNEVQDVVVEGDTIRASGGTVLARVLKIAKDHGLMGLAKLHGVPGTFGAAVRGNVGVPDCEIGDTLVSATILFEDGHIGEVDREFFSYGYRFSALKETKDIILEATIRLTPGGSPEAIFEEMQQTLKMRKAKQPWGASGGSYFKNPSREYSAGFLIDQVGGKGVVYGGAQISEKHANFMLNSGGATSDDIQQLGLTMKQRVKEKFGIELHEEVEFIE